MTVDELDNIKELLTERITFLSTQMNDGFTKLEESLGRIAAKSSKLEDRLRKVETVVAQIKIILGGLVITGGGAAAAMRLLG